MNTLDMIVNGALQTINENIIDDLVKLGYSHDRAVKVVTEFDGFDFSFSDEEAVDDEIVLDGF